MSGSRARQLSRMMTDGEKGAIFVLYLSFIGWFFLAALVIVIGIRAVFISQSTMLAAVVISSFVLALRAGNFRRTLHFSA
jgi:uncharacterized membrane protein